MRRVVGDAAPEFIELGKATTRGRVRPVGLWRRWRRWEAMAARSSLSGAARHLSRQEQGAGNAAERGEERAGDG
jgi:hypothetical protein